MYVPLLAELKRRRVFRALIGYGIAAFAVLQIVEPVSHGLHWPDPVLSYVVVALAAGFPIVVALAWIFDVSGGRIERTAPTASDSRIGGVRLALVVIAIGALAAAPGMIWYFVVRGGSRGAPAAGQTPSIAVLPFVNLTGDKENEYFSDGITEEIINALANVEGLRVVARTSAFSFKGTNVNVRKVGEELNVATVLEGSVRRDGNQLRVSAQLIGARDGYHLWSKIYDRELRNVFAVEDELARAIVDALKPKLVERPRLVAQSTANAKAHDLYLRGRFFWNQRNKEGLAKAAALFEQAIASDPTYALAHTGLADCYNLSVDYGGGRAGDVLPKAKLHALKALDLDDSLGEAHVSLASIIEHDYDWTASEREFKRAIELKPGYATAHHWYALSLAARGRMGEAMAEAERALELDPTSLVINTVVALVFYHQREFDRAIEQALRTLELDRTWAPARLWLAFSYAQKGKLADALGVLDQASNPSNMLAGVRAEVLALSGDREGARRLLATVENRFAVEPIPRSIFARIYVALGDRDAAFAWLEKAVEERDQSARTLKSSPQWDSIRSEPRFQALLARMNLQ
jgi:TolB-like protein/Tfp pilus assembly protein PilF